jgi:outer membrane protein TolC
MRSIALLILSALSIASTTYGQLVRLDSCISWAYDAQLYAEQHSLIDHNRELAMKNSSKVNLPSFVVDGTATYQNENITIQIPVPGIEAPVVPVNFNRLLINFNQSIYNGGLAARKKWLDSLAYDAQGFELEIQRSKIRAQVTGIYGTIILNRSKWAILNKQRLTLQAKIKQLGGAVESGVGFKSDLLSLQAEQLNLDQQITEAQFAEQGLIAQLEQLTAHEIAKDSEFELPAIEIVDTEVSGRPEFQVLQSGRDILEAQKELSRAKRLPYIGIFGTVGYGYPGYDIFNSNPRPMALIGLKLKWNIIDYGASRNDREILSLNQSILNYEQKRLTIQLSAELEKQLQEIEKYHALLLNDKAIVAIRKQVTQQVGARLAGGTATSTDYLTQLNNEAVAELNSVVHGIKLKLARINYLIIQGK